MADVRTFDDTNATIVDLQTRLDDFKTTATVRAVTRPTGTLEATIRTIAPAGALMCTGQTVLRSDWPALLQFAIDQVILGGTNPVFGAGDGSTTFVIPNMTGRTIMGAGTLGADTYVLGIAGGTAKPVLSTAQMPAHTHPYTTDNEAAHAGHGAYAWGGSPVISNAGSNAIDGGYIDGGNHTHTGTATSIGSGSAMDIRQPSYVTNFMVWG